MTSPCEDPPDGENDSALCVEIQVVLDDVETCPIRDEVRSPTSVHQECVDGDCHVDATVPAADGQRAVHIEDDVEPGCPCPVFRDHGCIPRVTEVTEDGFVLEVFVPERGVLRDCVDRLAERLADLDVRRIQTRPNANAGEDSVVVDLEDLTDKQRSAAVMALSAGYYEDPRRTSLGELADELDISKSALSQRLTAVESKLARAAFGSDCEE